MTSSVRAEMSARSSQRVARRATWPSTRSHARFPPSTATDTWTQLPRRARAVSTVCEPNSVRSPRTATTRPPGRWCRRTRSRARTRRRSVAASGSRAGRAAAGPGAASRRRAASSATSAAGRVARCLTRPAVCGRPARRVKRRRAPYDRGVDDLRVVTLAAGDLEVRFAAGANMVGCSLRHRGEELLGLRDGAEAYLARGKTFGIPLLHPWANRLGAWRYDVAGRAVDLEGAALVRGDEHGLPIHGALPAGADWRVVDTTREALWAELDWAADPARMAIFPFAHRLELRAVVDGGALTIETTIVATGSDPVPMAFGFHPYLAPPGAPRERWEVELPEMAHLALDDRGLPTGAREPRSAERFTLGDRHYDDAFALNALPAEFAVSDGTRRIAVVFERGFPYAQVFAPPEPRVICFEPMTAPADALRTHHGLRCVDPGERVAAAFAVRVTRPSG